MRRSTITPLLLLALAATPALGEVIHLTDGRTLVGKIKRANAEQFVVTTADHRTLFLPFGDVKSIDVPARPANDPIATGRRLEALRRAVDQVDDPSRAVQQYRDYIAVNVNVAARSAAQLDMAIWQDRADRHLVRLGNRWIHPAARAQALADALADAAEARQLLKQGQFADADPVIATALSIDPQNVSALYLQGLLRLRQDQLPAARAAFETVAAILPDHGPTRVNLAIVAWQQGRYADALARYDEAMILAPANPAVLANVAAALAADLPPTVARNPVFARVTQRYQAQQQQLANRMTKMGLHPFGAAWLTDAELADVRKGQQQDQATLDALAADFEKVQDKIRATDLAIADTEITMHRSAVTSRPLPGPWLASYDGPRLSPVYYDLDNDADQLRARRAEAVAQLEDLRRRAATIRQRLTGATDVRQRPVGPEGTPVRPTSP